MTYWTHAEPAPTNPQEKLQTPLQDLHTKNLFPQMAQKLMFSSNYSSNSHRQIFIKSALV